MPLRVGFDMDGVVADLESAISREAQRLFPKAAAKTANADAAPPADDEVAQADAASTDVIADLEGRQAQRRRRSSREQRRLWQHLANIPDFWETLDEVEEGAVAHLAAVAAARRWEVIFLTKRPQTAGASAQLQSQRWLAAKGFPLPSVFVVQGSRGAIATALGLQAIVDDRLENCLDVLADSDARVFLRCDTLEVPHGTRRLVIHPVTSMRMCLDRLIEMDSPLHTVTPSPTPDAAAPVQSAGQVA